MGFEGVIVRPPSLESIADEALDAIGDFAANVWRAGNGAAKQAAPIGRGLLGGSASAVGGAIVMDMLWPAPAGVVDEGALIKKWQNEQASVLRAETQEGKTEKPKKERTAKDGGVVVDGETEVATTGGITKKQAEELRESTDTWPPNTLIAPDGTLVVPDSWYKDYLRVPPNRLK
ncbi:MAG: hypothetical protein IAF58_06530 [Leptolyngbya sp.]|nr:hypothetical protein [Candidatus Melainabacteria bacterium]